MEACGHCGSVNCATQGALRGLTRCLHTSQLRDAGEKPKPLGKWKRAELDEEARRLDIEIEASWKKGDVVSAIEAQRVAA